MKAPAALLLLLAGCMTPAAEAPGAPGTAAARLGETVRLGAVRVRPIAVTEDSRCPQDVTCVWAGRLKLRVSISGVAGQPELILGEPYALPGGGTLTLVSALPAPRHNPAPGTEAGPANRFGFRLD